MILIRGIEALGMACSRAAARILPLGRPLTCYLESPSLIRSIRSFTLPTSHTHMYQTHVLGLFPMSSMSCTDRISPTYPTARPRPTSTPGLPQLSNPTLLPCKVFSSNSPAPLCIAPFSLSRASPSTFPPPNAQASLSFRLQVPASTSTLWPSGHGTRV